MKYLLLASFLLFAVMINVDAHNPEYRLNRGLLNDDRRQVFANEDVAKKVEDVVRDRQERFPGTLKILTPAEKGRACQTNQPQ